MVAQLQLRKHARVYKALVSQSSLRNYNNGISIFLMLNNFTLKQYVYLPADIDKLRPCNHKLANSRVLRFSLPQELTIFKVHQNRESDVSHQIVIYRSVRYKFGFNVHHLRIKTLTRSFSISLSELCHTRTYKLFCDILIKNTHTHCNK